MTYFSCCYLVNRFGALLSLSICQFPLGGFKVKVLAVHFHITHESFTCMNGHWGLFCSLGTLLRMEDRISDAYQIMIFIYIYMTHSQMLGKFEYGGGPIFKVVLEC